MGITLDHVRSLSAVEIDIWSHYFQTNPQGEKRHDLQAAMIAATIANYAPHRRRGSRDLRPVDFMFDFRPAGEQRKSDKEMEMTLKTLAKKKD